MQVKIKQSWLNIRDSLWFVPSVMAVVSAILALVLIEVDNRVTYDDIPIDFFLYGGKRDGARSVLSTIASSMVTIAGVTFSITLVALTMASSQFGPRLLRNFIADKGNQMVIGTFIATFIFSLIVLLTIRGSSEDEFVPKISVVFGFLLAVFSLGVLIYFIHHVTTSIQADYVIRSSFSEFCDVINKYMVNEDKDQPDISKEALLKTYSNAYTYRHPVYFHRSGFVQSIDFEGLCDWAAKNEAVVHTRVYAGDFATIHEPFAWVFHHSLEEREISENIRRFMVIGYQRTPNQDPLFSLRQITEVGVRALSPGTNDPHTAVTCIQWMGAALSILSRKQFPALVSRDSTGAVRVIKTLITYNDFVNVCFNQVLHFGKTNPFIVSEVLQALKKAMSVAHSQQLRDVLRNKASDVYENAKGDFGAAAAGRLLDEPYREIMQAYSRS